MERSTVVHGSRSSVFMRPGQRIKSGSHRCGDPRVGSTPGAWCFLVVLLSISGPAGAERQGDPLSPPVGAEVASREPATAHGDSLPLVVATTTMLGTATADLAREDLRILTLIPAQGCPGHYDLSPKSMAEAAEARLILVHDYQKPLGERMRKGDPGRAIHYLPTSGPQTLPEHYAALCRHTAALLVEAFPAHADSIRDRLVRLERAIAAEGTRHRARAAAPLADRRLLVAEYQEEFVRWAGGDPVVLFPRTEDLAARTLDRILQDARRKRVDAAVGNEQWGDREVRALSDLLGVPWVMLSNYPDSSGPGAWLRLLRHNTDRLVSLVGDE